MLPAGSNKSDISSRTGRTQNEEEPKNNIKLDYSETYYENDMLEQCLENKLSNLHRAKYKSGLDREASFKVARKAAENMQSLSEAIRRGSIPSSVTLYQTGKVRRDSECSKEKNIEKLTDGIKDLNTVQNEQQGQELENADENVLDSKPKTMNTLTMFALSLHKFKTGIGKKQDNQSNQQVTKKRSYSAKTAQMNSQKRDMSRYRRSARYARQHLKEGEALEVLDDVPTHNYGIETRKKKTKSRRELLEMSKIEQEDKFDIPNKPEERRKKLYEWAKGDPKSLDFRIQTFLNDVEDFKRKNSHSDIGIDPSLFSKSDNCAY